MKHAGGDQSEVESMNRAVGVQLTFSSATFPISSRCAADISSRALLASSWCLSLTASNTRGGTDVRMDITESSWEWNSVCVSVCVPCVCVCVCV